jgi:hypothetical protein
MPRCPLVDAMTQADRIRQFVLDQVIAPARQQGRTEVVVRAGDVHQQMSLTNAMPAVCSAIGSSKFEHLAGVTKTELRGPANGANVYFTFNLGARPSAIMVVKQREAIPTLRQSHLNLDVSGTVGPGIVRQEETVTFCSCAGTVHVQVVPEGTNHRRGKWGTLVCPLGPPWACDSRNRNRAL